MLPWGSELPSLSLWSLQRGRGSGGGLLGNKARGCRGHSLLSVVSRPASPSPQALSLPSPTPESLGASLGDRAAALPSRGPVPGSVGLGWLTAPAHAWPSSPSPGAEWRQPPGGGVAGAGQGRAPSPHEEQEIPGGAGGCREAPRGRPLPAGQCGRPGAGPPHGRRPLLGCRPVLQTWAGSGAHAPTRRGQRPGSCAAAKPEHRVRGAGTALHPLCPGLGRAQCLDRRPCVWGPVGRPWGDCRPSGPAGSPVWVHSVQSQRRTDGG